MGRQYTLRMSTKRTPFQLLTAICIVTTALIVAGCTELPDANLRQLDIGVERQIGEEDLTVTFSNPAAMPLRMSMSSTEPDVDAIVSSDFILGPTADSTFVFDISGIDTSLVRGALRFSFTFGDPAAPITPIPLRWPFPSGETVRIVQEYNGSFSHTSDFSRYALDFDLGIGDTVSVADDGVIVGVIEGYDVGGNSRKYRDFANYITVFHPHSGLSTQYVHLEPQGSFVAVGDTVTRGQNIGTVGLTGFTSSPHLHFNVLVPDSSGGMISYPVSFEDGTDGAALSRGDSVSH